MEDWALNSNTVLLFFHVFEKRCSILALAPPRHCRKSLRLARKQIIGFHGSSNDIHRPHNCLRLGVDDGVEVFFISIWKITFFSSFVFQILKRSNFPVSFLHKIMDVGGEIRRGVRASRNFRKGEFVLEYAGDYISRAKEFKSRCQFYDDHNIPGSFFFWFKFNNQWNWWEKTKTFSNFPINAFPIVLQI